MKLKGAKLCIECDEIYDGQFCPQCGADQGGWLRMWLAPPAEQKAYLAIILPVGERPDSAGARGRGDMAHG